jgi:four helix bundle protein
MSINSHRDLLVWQKCMHLVQEVYVLSQQFPSDERFGLISQVRRAAVSVPSNIAEGYGRGSTPDYIRFLRAARGSLYELDTQLLIASQLTYITSAQYASIEDRLKECSRMLISLIRSLEEHTKVS